MNAQKIYTTSNYAMFRTLEGNRDVGKRASLYLKSIHTVGQILPIVINEKNEVIDGQARLECCKMLGIPVKYIVEEGLRFNHVLEVNQNTKKWSMKDIINGKAATGNTACIYLKALFAQFPGFDLRVIYKALTGLGNTGGRIIEDLDRLDVSARDYENAVERLTYLNQFLETVKKMPGNKHTVLLSILWLYDHPGIDKKRLVSSFLKHYTTMEPMPTMKSAMEQLEKVYNYHSKTPVFFVDDHKAEVRNSSKRSKSAEKPKELIAQVKPHDFVELTSPEDRAALRKALMEG